MANLSPVSVPVKPSPPESADGAGAGGDWTLLTTAGNEVIAHLVMGRLGEEDIECVLDAFNPSPGAWLKPFGDPLAPVKLYVHKHDLARASLVLHEVDHRPPPPDQQPPLEAKRLWWLTITLVVVAFVLLLIGLFGGAAGLPRFI